MKSAFYYCLTALIAVMTGSGYAHSQTNSRSGDLKHFPGGSSPFEIGNRVAARFLASPHSNYGNPNPPRLITYPEVCTWYGALAFAHVTENNKLKEGLAKRFDPLFNDEAHLVPPPDHVDHTVFGAVPLELYRQSANRKYLDMGKNMADAQWELPPGKQADTQAIHYQSRGLTWQTRMWIDDMYMITAVQTQAYRATGDEKYINRAAEEMVAYLDSLQRPNGLFYHAPDVPFFWGRGNGWVAAGMAELLYSLPANNVNRPRILKGYRKMMNALLKYQTEQGMWRQLIDGPDSWPETSSTGMFTFAMITGVKEGWLGKKRFAPAARRGWLGLISYLDENADIREVCQGTNKKNDRQHYLDRLRFVGDMHGQAPVLWSAAALLR